ncbi:MAG TPA: hypothetical protein VME63_15905 [Dyella sp.]|uniref:hypothetical protein n=1 Tax=Dyella sp. TaxID=1869338 RepID=UPI002BA0B7F6|nr:hypothetical protein [Dyella sp.]HTV86885.1 hypothetical protein [Dyella sp.]
MTTYLPPSYPQTYYAPPSWPPAPAQPHAANRASHPSMQAPLVNRMPYNPWQRQRQRTYGRPTPRPTVPNPTGRFTYFRPVPQTAPRRPVYRPVATPRPTAPNPTGRRAYFRPTSQTTPRQPVYQPVTTTGAIPNQPLQIPKIIESPAGSMRFRDDYSIAKPLSGNVRHRAMTALNTGIQEVKQAITALDSPARWSADVQNRLRHLIPGGLQNANERSAFKNQLNAILYGMKRTVAKNANNIGTVTYLWGGGHAHPGTDNIHFTEANLLYPPATFLARTMIHEHAHLYLAGGGTDYWYIDGNLRQKINSNGKQYPFTFYNAMNNADTLALAAQTLSTVPRQA